MKQGLERLFWLLGGILILPFIIQQGITLSATGAAKNQVTQMGSLPQTPQSPGLRQSNVAPGAQHDGFDF